MSISIKVQRYARSIGKLSRVRYEKHEKDIEKALERLGLPIDMAFELSAITPGKLLIIDQLNQEARQIAKDSRFDVFELRPYRAESTKKALLALNLGPCTVAPVGEPSPMMNLLYDTPFPSLSPGDTHEEWHIPVPNSCPFRQVLEEKCTGERAWQFDAFVESHSIGLRVEQIGSKLYLVVPYDLTERFKDVVKGNLLGKLERRYEDELFFVHFYNPESGRRK